MRTKYKYLEKDKMIMFKTLLRLTKDEPIKFDECDTLKNGICDLQKTIVEVFQRKKEFESFVGKSKSFL